MSAKGRRPLVPGLRFAEFREAGEWESKKLDDNDVSSFVKKRLPLSGIARENYVSTENILPDFGGITTAAKLPPSGSFTAYRRGDILIANIRSYLKKIWVANKNGGASNDIIVVRSKKNNSFLSFILQNEVFINYVMQGAKGVKMPRGDIKLIKRYPFSMPELKEQQKIAACLTALDDLISATTGRLDALKQHKQGLMQQLFPTQGETVPRLRFAEFRDAGEWVKKTLIEVADYENGKAHEKDIDEHGKYIVVNSKFISTEGEVIKYSNTSYCPVNKGDILMVLSDVPNGKAIAKCFYVNQNDRYSVNQRICKITVFHADKLFLFYMIDRNPYFLAFDDGVNQTNLRKDDVLNFSFLLPENQEEQQKIAACLTALDDLIAAQTQKIAELKTHKRGLMQQLFPTVDEMN